MTTNTTNEPESSRPGLYQRIGGEKAIEAAVDLFYQKVLADPSLAPFFDGIDMDAQRDHQRKFLTTALGGPSVYGGPGLRRAHTALVARGLRDEHFDAVITHLANTLRELGVPEDDVGAVGAIGASVRGDVLNR